jgi:hypothetical protein
MRAGRYGVTLLLLAGLGWHGSADASPPQNKKSAEDRLPISTRCISRCNELEKTCEEHERIHPTCSVVDICFEEKAQCEALCRPRAMLKLRAGS